MKQHLHFLLRKCTPFLLALAVSQSSFGQISLGSTIEAGVSVGPSNFLGDLGGTRGRGMTFLKDNNFPLTKLMFGAHVSTHPSPLWGIRLQVNYGQLSGEDEIIRSNGGLEEARKFRNSNFRSKLAEAYVAAEIYPTVLTEYDPTDEYKKFRPYALIGVGVFHFNPQGTDPATGLWVNLKELSTEGQGFAEYPNRKPYKLTQLNIPIGVGIKYFISDRTSLALEVVHRKTFTDYIDDVSTNYIDPALFDQYFGVGTQKSALAKRMANKSDLSGSAAGGYLPGEKRGTPSNNDGYYHIGFKINFRIKGGDEGYKNMKCPTLRF
ncbi:MAG TPA: hypothetical protein PLQ65_04065 [Flavihumibacter sp.]|nr:hypothetical protein [Bacteroidota bacterium]HOA37195.1 hypothetical protein [Flavihumibacter sp.]HQD08815.1 hypothetical protein [Flavihumibacter sp.]